MSEIDKELRRALIAENRRAGAIQRALRKILTRYGEESSFGDKDFWVDDDYLGGFTVGCSIFDKLRHHEEIVRAIWVAMDKWPEWFVVAVFMENLDEIVRFRIDHREIRTIPAGWKMREDVPTPRAG